MVFCVLIQSLSISVWRKTIAVLLLTRNSLQQQRHWQGSQANTRPKLQRQPRLLWMSTCAVIQDQVNHQHQVTLHCGALGLGVCACGRSRQQWWPLYLQPGVCLTCLSTLLLLQAVSSQQQDCTCFEPPLHPC